MNCIVSNIIAIGIFFACLKLLVWLISKSKSTPDDPPTGGYEK